MDVRRVSTIGVLALLLGGGVALATSAQQDKPKPGGAPPKGGQEKPAQPPAGGAGQMMVPAPGPEHKLLEKYVGTWDCDLESSFIPGKPEKTKATNVCRKTCGGFWFVSDFDGTLMGGPFSGHGVSGYDTAQKKFVDNWFDSTTASGATAVGTFDEKTNTFNWDMQMREMDGSMSHGRETDVWKDADTHEWTLFAKGPDGKEGQMLKITYHRKK
jgi:hypothetical protein